MEPDHEQLYQAASNAVDALFNDTSVSTRETKRDLTELIYEIQSKLDSLDL